MKDERREDPVMSESGEDDIEILEIVGLDEDGEEITFEEETDGGTEPAAVPVPDSPASDDRERLLRLHADFENLKKRSETEISEQRRYASTAVVERLLPIIDNFERALALESSQQDDRSFRQGVELIYRQMMDELKREGLVPLDSVGTAFDPNLHEAVETSSNGGHPPNMVIKEFLKGYRFRDRLLRPAMVRVSIAAGPDGDHERDTE